MSELVDSAETWALQVEDAHGDLVRAIALAAWESVVRLSPVDTGRFRGSWNLSVGSADLSVLPEGSHSAPQRPSPNVPPFSTVILSNALPYAERLEFGYSRQAPSGMLRLTMQMLEEGLRQ